MFVGGTCFTVMHFLFHVFIVECVLQMYTILCGYGLFGIDVVV